MTRIMKHNLCPNYPLLEDYILEEKGGIKCKGRNKRGRGEIVMAYC